MDNTTMSAILWIVAGGILGLYLLRRRKRNVLNK
jgi:LPXTG-motif cell wall-anchored protein